MRGEGQIFSGKNAAKRDKSDLLTAPNYEGLYQLLMVFLMILDSEIVKTSKSVFVDSISNWKSSKVFNKYYVFKWERERYFLSLLVFRVFFADFIIFAVNKIFRTVVWIRHEIIEFIKQMPQILDGCKTRQFSLGFVLQKVWSPNRLKSL